MTTQQGLKHTVFQTSPFSRSDNFHAGPAGNRSCRLGDATLNDGNKANVFNLSSPSSGNPS